MNHDPVEIAIGATWLGYGVGFSWFAWGVFALGRRIDGPLWQWPVPGRHLLALFLTGLSVVALDVARIRFEPHWLEPYWSSDANSWSVLMIRLIPLVLLTVIIHRVRSGGLVRADGSSKPDAESWDGVNRRSGVERRQGVAE